jgi:hypothetical protein
LHLSKILTAPHDQIRAIRGFYANIKNSLLELPLSKVSLVRLFTERVGKVFAWLDQWRLIPDGSNFVREQLDEDSGEVLLALTPFQRKDLCVESMQWIKDFFAPSVKCISFVWLEPSRLHKLDYVRLAPVLGLTVEPDGAQKACFDFVTKILKRPHLLSWRNLIFR